uniref:Uncharacterized protein n=1 Tax=Nicotiana tabacum TaxID=4097 RepID=A0A1S3WZJ3_TOBAC|nr:PREDICTED: uncharacterized protein LOC107759598 [Nicotiana tabacum]
MAVKGDDLAPHEIESVFLRKFRETLTKGALTWYLLFPEHSIDTFEMLVDSFIKAHAGARKVQARKADIFRIVQGESELLREFKLKESFLEFQETTWADVYNRYESKIRIEDDYLDFPSSVKGREWENNKEKSKYNFNTDGWSSRRRFLPYERAEGHGRGFRSTDRFAIDRRINRGRNHRSLQKNKTSDSSYPRLSEYNFNVSVVDLVSSMRNIKGAWFLKTMRSDPGQRDPNLWCEYHETNIHLTGGCGHLCEEVSTLLKNGHLSEYISDRAKNNYGRKRDNAEPSKAGENPLRLMINVIFGGNEINGVTFSVAKNTKVLVTHNKRLREVIADDITFTEEDADGLLLPHNDALVISLNVLDFELDVFW